MQLEGKTALVTGADSGIGRAIAATFAREGADVAVHYGVDREGAEETAARVRAHGRRAPVLQADLGDPRAGAPLVERAIAALGRLDLLVNNAGTSSPTGAALEQPLDDFLHLLMVDLASPFTIMQAAGRHMAARGSGAMVVITSASQAIVDPASTAYHAAKGGLKNLAESFALELAPKGVRVNSLAPGLIATPMTAQKLQQPGQPEQAAKKIPLGRVGAPEDVADAALFLASDAARYVTGASYFVDGGVLLVGSV